jgi:hypothetical protein
MLIEKVIGAPGKIRNHSTRLTQMKFEEKFLVWIIRRVYRAALTSAYF